MQGSEGSRQWQVTCVGLAQAWDEGGSHLRRHNARSGYSRPGCDRRGGMASCGLDSEPPPSWQIVEVARSELARGDATAPPSSIDIPQVQEHALRHLAWLRQDDPTIADLLDD